MRARMLTIGIVAAFLAALLPGGVASVAAKGPQPPGGRHEPALLQRSPEGVLQRSPEGLWFTPEGRQAPAAHPAAQDVPQGSGGPDDYGYTWSDAVPYNWIDASGGAETDIGTGSDRAGPIDIGFPFKFYENSYSQVWIRGYGYLTFQSQSGRSSSRIPSASVPNDVVAPHWVPVHAVNGYVRTLQGGSAPDRWFVVEWNQVESRCCSDDAEVYTFEVVLHENGDIVFQYGPMTVHGNWYCQSSGIEDSTGLDGLATSDYCDQIAPDHAVRIYRPAPAARVRIWPLHQGRLVGAGVKAAFEVPIRNTGELGADTYDLWTASSWPVALFTADGRTPLTDSDGDGTVDTGPMAQGASATVVVQVAAPDVGNVGDDSTTTLLARSSLDTARSKTATLKAAIPAPFAQVFSDDEDGAMSLLLTRPAAQVERKVTDDWTWGYDPAVAETSTGLVYVWDEGRSEGDYWVDEVWYAVADRHGNVTRGPAKLTDHSGVTWGAYDWDTTVAAAPNGQIGVLWVRYLWNPDTDLSNYNIFFALLDAWGNPTHGPVSVTNNPLWGEWDDYNWPYFWDPTLAATDDNRFLLAWAKEYLAPPEGDCTADCWMDDIYHAVYDTSGAQVKPVTQFTSDTPGWDEAYYYPNAAGLSGGRALLTWERSSEADIYYAVLDSNGNTVRAAANLVGDGWNSSDWRPDAVQLSDGRTVVAWTGGDYPDYRIRFAVLDAAYNRVAGPSTLDNPAALQGDGYVSAAADADGHAILTWMDYNYSYRPNLYYALVDGSGWQLTGPTILRTGQGTSPNIETSYLGFGNTSYSFELPTSDEVDGWLTAGALAGGPPGGVATIGLSFGNHGQTAAQGVVLTAELDPALSFSGARPAPASVVGQTVTWNLPDLDFLGEGRAALYVGLPADPLGSRYPVVLSLSSAGPEAFPADNSATVQVMASSQAHLPLLLKGR